MIAADLALRLGVDLQLESIEDIRAEIERLAPAFAGLTTEILEAPWAADGVLVPIGPDVQARAEGTPVSIEGMRVPAGPTDPTSGGPGGRDEPDDGDEDDGEEDGREDQGDAGAGAAGGADVELPPTDVPGRPPLVQFRAPDGRPAVPTLDNYSLRLIATRKLYDLGTLVQHSPSLAELAPGSRLRLNPYDFNRLGIDEGGEAKVTSARASANMAVVSDPDVPRGRAALLVNQPGADPFALIDATAIVTDIRVETV